MKRLTGSGSLDWSAPPSPLSSTPSSQPAPPPPLPSSLPRHHVTLHSLQLRDLHTSSPSPPPALQGATHPHPYSHPSSPALRFHIPPPLPQLLPLTSRSSYPPSAVVRVTDEGEEGGATTAPSSPNIEPDDLPSLSSSSSFSLSRALPSTPTFSRFSLHRPSYTYPQLSRDDLASVDLDPRSPLPVWHPRLRRGGGGARSRDSF